MIETDKDRSTPLKAPLSSHHPSSCSAPQNNAEATDPAFMQEALIEARLAAAQDEVPIGAVTVRDGQILSRAHNLRQTNRCATHHAELLAIEEACRRLGGWRLPGVTLYVTMEPCAMCAGAIINARIERVVYGVPDLRFGALGSLLDLSALPLNHTPQVTGGVLADEARELLRSYFQEKRLLDKQRKRVGNDKYDN